MGEGKTSTRDSASKHCCVCVCFGKRRALPQVMASKRQAPTNTAQNKPHQRGPGYNFGRDFVAPFLQLGTQDTAWFVTNSESSRTLHGFVQVYATTFVHSRSSLSQPSCPSAETQSRHVPGCACAVDSFETRSDASSFEKISSVSFDLEPNIQSSKGRYFLELFWWGAEDLIQKLN